MLLLNIFDVHKIREINVSIVICLFYMIFVFL